MARTRVDLANSALRKLVRDPIRDFSGSDPDSLHMGQEVDNAIQFVAAEFQIPAARAKAQLMEVSSVTYPGWAHVYLRPADTIRIWEVTPSIKQPRTSYQYEELLSPDVASSVSYICSNVPEAWAKYSSTRVDLSRLTPQQFEIAATKLAELCCMILKKDKELLAYLQQSLQRQVQSEAAKVYNAEVDDNDIDAIPEFIGVRSL